MTIKYASIVPLIGGMTLAGIKATGVKPSAIMTYSPFKNNELSLKKYLPDVPYHVLDEDGDIDAGKDFDFISALCPCAGLSLLSSGTQEVKEAANSWMFKTAEHVLGHLKPKVFWGENAPALYALNNAAGTKVRQKLEDLAERHGYTLTYYYTNTQLHGVPQKRLRTFYFFWKETDQVPELGYYNVPHKTYGEYMKEIPADATQHSEYFEKTYNDLRRSRFSKFLQYKYGDVFPEVIRDYLRANNKTSITICKFVLGNKNLCNEMMQWFVDNNDQKGIDYLERILNKKFVNGKNIWDDSASIFLPETHFHTLMGRTVCSAHPYESRSLTPRECMHLMALPEDFTLHSRPGKKIAINHVFQNVPLCTSTDMTKEVIKYLNGELKMIKNTKVIHQNNIKRQIEKTVSTNNLISF
jgi:site-specific DNA-cytosine methylase